MAQIEGSLTPAQRETLSSLRSLQEQQASLSADFEAAVLKLKLEYEAKYKPLYEQRRDLLLKGADGEAQTGEGCDKTTGTPVSGAWVGIISCSSFCGRFLSFIQSLCLMCLSVLGNAVVLAPSDEDEPSSGGCD